MYTTYQMKIIGHRGAKGLAPENTLAAIQKGLDHHVDEVEIDVRVTRDYVVVLSHDAALHAGGSATKIITATFAELKELCPDLTTLEEAVALVAGKARLYIEVKSGEPVEPIIDVLKKHEHKMPADTIEIASRSQSVLLDIRRALPDMPLRVIEIWSSLRAHLRAKALDTNRVSMLESWLWPGFIRAMEKRGYELYAFPPTNDAKKRLFARFGLSGCTENPTKARRWAAAGLAGVITDYPDLFDKH